MSAFIAVRLADRYFDTRSPDSIGQVGNLRRFVLLACIICSVSALAIIYLGHTQRTHSAVIHDVDVAFELSCAPPEPSFGAVNQLVPLRFDEGQKPAALASSQNQSLRSALDEQKAQEQKTFERLELKQRFNSTPEAPLAVTPINEPRGPVANVLANPFAGAAANAATASSDSYPAGGSEYGQVGADGRGEGRGAGVGSGDTSSLAGGDFGASQLIAMRTPPTAMGNIAPYKRDLAARIKAAWHPQGAYEQVEVQISLSHDGKVLETQILKSTGNTRIDSSLLEAIDSTDFAALPDWFQGSHLKIRLILKNI